MQPQIDLSKYTINACVGNTRINFGKWYSPIGKTSVECTYCEWCVANGCVDIKDVYDVCTVRNCNCDCPNKKDHEKIKEYTCEKHNRCIMSCDTGTCEMPNCEIYTCSGMAKYCAGCSAIFGICEVCGEK